MLESASESASFPCPVCKSGDTIVWYPGQISALNQVSFSYSFRQEHTKTFEVRRCRECTHAFCAPLPPDIAAEYVDVVDEEYLLHSRARRTSAAAVIKSIRRRGGKGRLLDVGCATGDFVIEAKVQGFDAEGLELSTWSSTIAHERGLTIHRKTLADLAAEAPHAFDVITLIGVVEHFAAPRAEIRHLRTLLRPGGFLVFWTGDVDSITSRILRRRWWYWQGQHIQYFTRRSLQRLCADAELHTVAVETYPFAADYETISNSLRRYRLNRLLSAAVRPLFWIRQTLFLRIPGEMLLFSRSTGGTN